MATSVSETTRASWRYGSAPTNRGSSKLDRPRAILRHNTLPDSAATATKRTENIETFDTAAKRAPKVTTSSPTATQSIRSGVGSTGPGSVRQPAIRAMAEIGTISRKIHRHEPTWSKAAAIAGPAKPRIPHTFELAAKARPTRWLG